MDRISAAPLAVIETKGAVDEIDLAVSEAERYADALWDAGWQPLAVGLAGQADDEFRLRIYKRVGAQWRPVTYDNYPIGWIPTRVDLERVAVPSGPTEIRPSIPPLEVLAARADEINRLLRESRIQDQQRPAVVGAMMLALWHSRGRIRRDPAGILRDINSECRDAFIAAGKADMARSLRVDEANDKLKEKSRRIATILERLNVTVLTAEHDYLGQLYEAFFRYTGGNTIGQYFTPRHITKMMADLCEITKDDTVLDPACGTGGFLIACMDRILREHHFSREQMVSFIKEHTNLIGFEDEPVTAALCVANMILRGDGSTGVHRADSLTAPIYPVEQASVVLMNPPFPHAKTDTPPERFVERALQGLHHRGKLAVIMPRSSLGKREKAHWRAGILERNTLDAVIVLPDELFAPYASSYTAIVLITKGVPHPKGHGVFFARVENDGFRRRKNIRAPQEGEQVSLAIRAFHSRETIPGFCGWSAVDPGAGWDSGYYIPARVLSHEEIAEQSAGLARSDAAFVVSHAHQLLAMEAAIERGELLPHPHPKAGKQLHLLNSGGNTIGDHFEIVYGQKALHSKERLAPGPALVISSSGFDNGCYGFFDFDDLIEPDFVTVPSTGSIGRAHVQEWPCGVTDDCLLLLPKEGVPKELMYVAASVVRKERWRFNYGRKITPDRIAGFPLPSDEAVLKLVHRHIDSAGQIKRLALEEAEDEYDERIARERIAEITTASDVLISGADLESELSRLLSDE